MKLGGQTMGCSTFVWEHAGKNDNDSKVSMWTAYLIGVYKGPGLFILHAHLG
jgi:hypothetical protein